MKVEIVKDVVVLKKPEKDCPNCRNLSSFLNLALNGEYNEHIQFITTPEHEETYQELVDKYNIMSMPAIIDIKNNKLVATGFDPATTNEFLISNF